MEQINRETTISLPELSLVAGSRMIMGSGIGLLMADRLDRDQRKAVGWTLAIVGALITIPIAIEVLGGRRLSRVPSVSGTQTRSVA